MNIVIQEVIILKKDYYTNGQGLSMNVVIIAAILLMVLVILAVLLLRRNSFESNYIDIDVHCINNDPGYIIENVCTQQSINILESDCVYICRELNDFDLTCSELKSKSLGKSIIHWKIYYQNLN